MTPPPDRDQWIQRARAVSGPKLEIGPSWRPCLDASDSDVFFSDYLTTEQLRDKVAQNGGDSSNVPQIHFPTAERPLHQAVAGLQFQLVFSSHALEHHPCLVSHLQQVEAVLGPGGTYRLIVPDHRYCFDHFLRASVLEDVLQAYADRRTRPHPLRVFCKRHWRTHNDPVRHWRGDHGPDRRSNPDGRESEVLDQAIREDAEGIFNDTHSWSLTFEGFAEIVESLRAMGFIRLRLQELHPTQPDTFEFFALLARP